MEATAGSRSRPGSFDVDADGVPVGKSGPPTGRLSSASIITQVLHCRALQAVVEVPCMVTAAGVASLGLTETALPQLQPGGGSSPDSRPAGQVWGPHRACQPPLIHSFIHSFVHSLTFESVLGPSRPIRHCHACLSGWDGGGGGAGGGKRRCEAVSMLGPACWLGLLPAGGDWQPELQQWC